MADVTTTGTLDIRSTTDTGAIDQTTDATKNLAAGVENVGDASAAGVQKVAAITAEIAKLTEANHKAAEEASKLAAADISKGLQFKAPVVNPETGATKEVVTPISPATMAAYKDIAATAQQIVDLSLERQRIENQYNPAQLSEKYRNFEQGLTRATIEEAEKRANIREEELRKTGPVDVTAALEQETSTLAQLGRAYEVAARAKKDFTDLPLTKQAGEIGAPESRRINEAFLAAVQQSAVAVADLTSKTDPLAASLARVEAQMSAVAGRPVKINIAVPDASPEVQAALAHIRQQADANPVEVPVKVDPAEARQSVVELQQLLQRADTTATIKIDADTSAATAKVEKYVADAERKGAIATKYDVDMDLALKSAKQLQAELAAINAELAHPPDISGMRNQLAENQRIAAGLKQALQGLDVEIDPRAAASAQTLTTQIQRLEAESKVLASNIGNDTARLVDLGTRGDTITRLLRDRFHQTAAAAEDAGKGFSGLSGAVNNAVGALDQFTGGRASQLLGVFNTIKQIGPALVQAIPGGAQVATAISGVTDAALGLAAAFPEVALGVAVLTGALVVFGPQAVATASHLENLTVQFTVLLGSVAAAKNRIAEYRATADLTPFGVDEVEEAGRRLEVFGGRLLSTQQSLLTISDVAVTAGKPIEQLSESFGRLFAALQTGQGLGEVEQSFRELGVLTPRIQVQLNAISRDVQSGAIGMEEAWGRVEKAFDRFSGASAQALDTLSGKTKNLERVNDQTFGRLGTALLPLVKSGVDLLTSLFEGLGMIVHSLEVPLTIITTILGTIISLASKAAELVFLPFELLGNALDTVATGIGNVANGVADFITGGQSAADRAKQIDEDIVTNQALVMDTYVANLDTAAKGSEDAWKRLSDVQTEGLNRNVAIAETYGRLTSEALAKGLASGLPEERRAAEAARDALTGRLRLLTADESLINGLTATFTRAGQTVNEEFLGNLLRMDPGELTDFAQKAGVSITDPFIQQLLSKKDDSFAAVLAVLSPEGAFLASAKANAEGATKAAVDLATTFASVLDTQRSTVETAIKKFGTDVGQQISDAHFIQSADFQKALSGELGPAAQKAALDFANTFGAQMKAHPLDFGLADTRIAALEAQKAGTDAVVAYANAALEAGASSSDVWVGIAQKFPDALVAARPAVTEAIQKSMDTYVTTALEGGKTDRQIWADLAKNFPNELNDARPRVQAAIEAQINSTADTLAQGGKNVRQIVREIAHQFPDALSNTETRAAIVNAVNHNMLAIAGGIRDKRSAVEAAYQQLQEDLLNPFNAAREKHVLLGKTVGINIAKGLKSGDPAVRAQAIGTAQLIADRLEDLKVDVTKIKGPTGKAIRDALAAGAKIAEEEAKKVPKGVDSGVKSGIPAVEQQVKNMTDPLTDPHKAIEASDNGYTIGHLWGTSLASGINGTYAAIKAAADAVDNLIGKTGSPPKSPESPFHHVDKDGANIGTAWAEGFAGAIVASVPTITNALTTARDLVAESAPPATVGAQPNGIGLRTAAGGFSAVSGELPRGNAMGDDRAVTLLGRIAAELGLHSRLMSADSPEAPSQRVSLGVADDLRFQATGA